MTNNKTTTDMQAELEDLRDYVFDMSENEHMAKSARYSHHVKRAKYLVAKYAIADDKASDDE